MEHSSSRRTVTVFPEPSRSGVIRVNRFRVIAEIEAEIPVPRRIEGSQQGVYIRTASYSVQHNYRLGRENLAAYTCLLGGSQKIT